MQSDVRFGRRPFRYEAAARPVPREAKNRSRQVVGFSSARLRIIANACTPGSTLSECTVIKNALVERGVPVEVILEEHRATNTGENVIFSLPIIDRAIGLRNIRTVICLGKACTSRRYLMTLQRHWPEVAKMLVAVNLFDTPVERWHENPEFRARVVREWRKIEPYRARGLIAEWL